MSVRNQKAKEEKAIILVWRLLADFFAYVYDASVDTIHCLLKRMDSTLSTDAEICEHKQIVQGEYYYGLGENQYTCYWFCEDCGDEIPDDYGLEI